MGSDSVAINWALMTAFCTLF